MTIILLVSSLVSYSQADYYWYKGTKVFLTKNNSKKYMLFETSDDATVFRNRTAHDKGKSKIDKFDEVKISATTKSFKKKKKKDYTWAVVSSHDKSDVADNEIALYSSSFYLSKDNKDIGLSHLFYVKVKQLKDTTLLMLLASENNVEILGNNEYMPLWFTLSCTKHSRGDALSMANLFYETEMFAASEPDLMTDDFLFCENDPLFIHQWALSNTGTYSNGSTGIDINYCQAKNITKGSSNIIVAVLDNGVELNHPDLNVYYLSFDTESGTSPSRMLGNHGVACAGIIGAKSNNQLGVAGIAPNSPIMSISNSFEEVQIVE